MTSVKAKEIVPATSRANEAKSTHTYNRECPVCKGFCQLAKVNSLTPYEEIDAEERRKRRLEGLAD